MNRFYIGLHQPADAHHFDRCCLHIGRLLTRRKTLGHGELLLDSQAFRILEIRGDHSLPPAALAARAAEVAQLGRAVVVVAQDYPCEAYMFARRLEHTGIAFTVADHQRLTIGRYDALTYHAGRLGLAVLPVLQGYRPAEYVDHIRQYGHRLPLGAWCGVGSVCKRNGNVSAIEGVLIAITDARPDLRLHGFGVKLTALRSSIVRACLWSADSMAWSYNARKNGRNGNSWREAEQFRTKILNQTITPRAYQYPMELHGAAR